MSLYAVGLMIVDLLLGLLTRRTHRHLDRIPRAGAAVVACNHISVSDPLVLACAVRRARRRLTFLAKIEVFSWPVVGWALRRTRQIPVPRADEVGRAESLAPAVAGLRAGWLIGIYPEGKITTEPGHRPMPRAHTGAVRMALAAGCPIVPVAQWGAQDLLGRDRRSALLPVPRRHGPRPGRPRRPRITVVVGEPITPVELRAAAGDDPLSAAGARAATELVMTRIRDLLAGIPGAPGARPAVGDCRCGAGPSADPSAP